MTEREFEKYLNEVYDDVSICGIIYNAGYALKNIDPTAFDVIQADKEAEWEEASEALCPNR